MLQQVFGWRFRRATTISEAQTDRFPIRLQTIASNSFHLQCSLPRSDSDFRVQMLSSTLTGTRRLRIAAQQGREEQRCLTLICQSSTWGQEGARLSGSLLTAAGHVRSCTSRGAWLDPSHVRTLDTADVLLSCCFGSLAAFAMDFSMPGWFLAMRGTAALALQP